MCSYKSSLLTRGLTLLVAAFVLLFSAYASAQSGHGTLWLIDGNDRESRDHEAHLRQVLESSRSSEHIVGREGIEARIERDGLEVPGCLDGTASCDSEFAAAIQSLALSLLVRLELRSGGTVVAQAYDNSGKLVRALEVDARNTRQAIMRAVSEITGATGQLLVDTQPSGASVIVDGEEVGKTPLNRTLAVGSYSIDVVLPGYGPVRDTMDVPPEGSSRRSFNLERLQATLTVRSGTPDAYIRIDNSAERLPINEALLIDPGPHRVTVEAHGYDSVTERFDFKPGQERELSATLAVSLQELTRRRIDAIHQRPLLLQVGLRYMRYGTDWNNAVERGGGERILCSSRSSTGTCGRAPVNSIGLDISAIYTWRFLDIEAFGLSVYRLAQPSKTIAFQLESNPSLQLSHVGGNRTLVRVGHVGVRHMLNEYIEPYARFGFSFAADRFRAEDTVGDTGVYRFKRAAVLFEMRAGTRIRINKLFYGYADAGVAFELRNSETKPAFELGGGVGFSLPVPWATPSDASSGRSLRQSATQENLPEEL